MELSLDSLVESVHETLRIRNFRLSVAESCTGGQLGSTLTRVPGSSDVFEGGIIAYSNRIKRDRLDVKDRTLKEHGAVSKHVAKEMVTGLLKTFQTSCGLSVTGVAGPTGGTKTKPVGLVFVGAMVIEGPTIKQYQFNGNRVEVRTETVEAALNLLMEEVENQETGSPVEEPR